MSKSLRDFLILHEGIRLRPYQCAAGKTTIGVGRNIDDRGISMDESMYLLDNDIASSRRELSQFDWYNNLDEVRKDVLCELHFNIGLSRLLQFKKMIAALTIFDYDEAGYQLIDSEWAKQVGPTRAKNMEYRLINGKYETK